MWRAARAAVVVAALAGLALLVVLLLPGISPEPRSPGPPELPSSTGGIRPGQPAGLPTEATHEPPGAAASQSTEPPESRGARSGDLSALGKTPSSRTPVETEPQEAGPQREETPLGAGVPPRSGNWVLDPEIHQQILADLPERDEVPYLSVRILRLMSQTLQVFPREDRVARAEARRRVAEIRRRIAERKRETRGDPAAVEALHADLLRLDQDLEVWRERVLQGEPALPESEL